MTNELAVRTIEGIEAPAPGTWVLDQAHTEIGFVARHLMVAKVRGRFGSFEGTIHVDEDPAQSRVEVSIDAASIDTGTEDRDNHLRSPEFLDVGNHPKLTFRGRGPASNEGRRFKLPGQLTIRGVTREVVLDVTYEGVTEDPWGNARAAFSASTEIDREEFGLTWNQALETGGVLVGNKVRIELDVQAVKN